MKCHCKTFWKLKFIIVGALISLVHFYALCSNEYILVVVDYVSK